MTYRTVDVIYEGTVDYLEYDDYAYEQVKNIFGSTSFENLLLEIDYWD